MTVPDGALRALRDRIDDLDDRLLALLAERLDVVRALGDLKAAHGATGRDPAREAAILARLAAKQAMPDDVLTLIWTALFTASGRVQARDGD